MEFISQISLLGIILVAGILGAIIGFEREMSGKSAGVRTHMFVAMASCTLVLLAHIIVGYFVASMPWANFQADPVRVIQAIIVGISFIGAGIIFKDTGHASIRNLSTASSVLLTTVVGIAVALQMFYIAIGIVLIMILANTLLVHIEKKVHPKKYNEK